jgi:hypothetical protein
MHYGSGSGSGSKPGFGSGSHLKCNKKVKNPKREANFLGNNTASDIEKGKTV